MADKAAIAAELLRRGVSPDEIAASGYPQVAQMGRSGLIAPRLDAPDPIARRSAYVNDYKKIGDERERLARFYPDMTQLDRFSKLNEQSGTGPIYGAENLNPIRWVANAVSPNVQEMSGIASGLQGKARPAGSGATSDFEQRLYRQGVPSPEKMGQVNGSIIAYMKGVLNEESDRLAFEEEFLRRNGSLAGSQQAWARFVSSNPYTVTNRSGRTEPNAKRQDWRAYFGLSSGPKGSPAANAPRKGADPFPGIRDGQIVEQGGVRYRRQGDQMIPVQ